MAFLSGGRGGFLGGSGATDYSSGGTITGNLAVTGTLAVTGATTLTGTTSMGSGAQLLLDASNSLTACPLAFVGDPNSGLRRIGADNPGLVANGFAAGNWTDSAMALAVNLTNTGTLTGNGTTTINSRFLLNAETVKTIDYAVTSSDAIVIMNGASKTATLPATPFTDQLVWIKNIDAGTATIARNGKTIDGAAADITLATMEAAFLYYNGTGWYRLGT